MQSLIITMKKILKKKKVKLKRTEQRSIQFNETTVTMKGEKNTKFYYMEQSERWRNNQENSKYGCTLT